MFYNMKELNNSETVLLFLGVSVYHAENKKEEVTVTQEERAVTFI